MRICLMIEGQEGVAWADWVALAQACERLGFDALFRSDHYLSVDGRGERGSLDAWGTVSALSALTSTLRFGTLVSPATFRRRMARVSLPPEAASRLAPAGAALARAEGFPVHAESMERRA